MRAPTSRLAAALLTVALPALALPTVTACASSGSSRGGEVGGLFDDGESDYAEQGRYAKSAPQEESYNGGYAPPPPPPPAPPMTTGAPASRAYEDAPMADSVTISSDESTTGSALSGVLDFAGTAIEGALSKPQGASVEARPEPQPVREPGLPSAGDPVAGDPAQGDKPPVESSASKRLVIYKGSLVVLVPAVEAAVEKLAARAGELGGYVENQTGNASSNNGTVTLRVPAAKFHELVNELGTYGQVTQKNLTASDVTKQVFDIELRLETAERSRQRLLDLLKVATKMEEILQIEGEVRRLTQEIEGMKGELRFLRDQVSFSTLAVTFYSNAPPPKQGPTRTKSRFDWINQVGLENVLYNF